MTRVQLTKLDLFSRTSAVGWLGCWGDRGCGLHAGSIVVLDVSGTAAATHLRGGGTLQIARDDQVVILPPVEVGWAGWCMMRVGASRGRACGGDVRSLGPILGEVGRGASPSALEGVALTTNEVAAVSVEGGAPIPTRSEPGLPNDLRAVVVEIRGRKGGPPEIVLSSLRFVPLNVKGAPISAAPNQSVPLGFEVPSEGWRPPSHAPPGACEITATNIPGLVELRAGVVIQLTQHPGLIDRPFLSCASTEYSLDNNKAVLMAGMLLDATHPGVTPGPLPNMKPLSGHTGVFQAPGEAGELLARRIPGAWLAVETSPVSNKASGLQHRLTLLEHLRATFFREAALTVPEALTWASEGSEK